MNSTECATARRTPEKMSGTTSGLLLAFLCVAASSAAYSLYSIWSASPRVDSGLIPVSSCVAETLTLSTVSPRYVVVRSNAEVVVVGCGFTEATQVRFNGIRHQALVLDDGHIRIGLTAAEVSAIGTITISLSNGKTNFGSAALSIVSPVVYWKFGGAGPWQLSPIIRLFLMVIFAGTCGASCNAIRLLADHIGEDRLNTSWLTFYLIQPAEGGAIALLVCLPLVSSLEGPDELVVCALAGLAGIWADVVLHKLQDLFQTLFKPRDDRGDRITGPRILTVQLPSAAVGVPYWQALHICGGVKPLWWSVTPALPIGLALDPSGGIVKGTPIAVTPEAIYRFEITDNATASFSADLTFGVSDTLGETFSRQIQKALRPPALINYEGYLCLALGPDAEGFAASNNNVVVQALAGAIRFEVWLQPDRPLDGTLAASQVSIKGGEDKDMAEFEIRIDSDDFQLLSRTENLEVAARAVSKRVRFWAGFDFSGMATDGRARQNSAATEDNDRSRTFEPEHPFWVMLFQQNRLVQTITCNLKVQQA